MKKCILAVYAALIVCLVALPASAGNCAHVSYGANYQAPYTPPYYAPQYYVPEHPYAIAVPTYGNFFSVAPDLAQVRVNREVAEDAATKASQKTLDAFLGALKANGLIGANAPQPPLQGPQPGTLVTPQSKQGGSNLERLQAMASESCLRCHNGPGKNGLDMANVAALSEAQLLKIQHRIIKSPRDPAFMPKSGKERVSDDYIDATNGRIDEVLAAKIPPAK